MTVMKLMSEDVHADLVTPLILEDATSGEKQYFIEGIFMEADVMNGNKRIYPRTILESQVEAYNKIISQGMAYGELDHPSSATVTMKDVSHRITELKMDGNNVIGKAVLLDNELGRTCKSALKTGGKLAVSSRGVGTLGEGSIVNPDFRLVTVDIVSNPSAPNAFVNGILENKEYILENNVLIEHHIGTLDRALATKGCVKTTEEIINTWIKSL